MADSVSSVVSQNHRMTIAGLAAVERSTKENSAWSVENRNRRNYTIAAINVAGEPEDPANPPKYLSGVRRSIYR